MWSATEGQESSHGSGIERLGRAGWRGGEGRSVAGWEKKLYVEGAVGRLWEGKFRLFPS